jgi:hypothetical protein
MSDDRTGTTNPSTFEQMQAKSLQELKKRKIALLIALVSLPIVPLVGALSIKLFRTEIISSLLLTAWFLYAIFAFVRVTFWSCPGCGKRSSGLFLWGTTLCRHCRVDSRRDPAPQA